MIRLFQMCVTLFLVQILSLRYYFVPHKHKLKRTSSESIVLSSDDVGVTPILSSCVFNIVNACSFFPMRLFSCPTVRTSTSSSARNFVLSVPSRSFSACSRAMRRRNVCFSAARRRQLSSNNTLAHPSPNDSSQSTVPCIAPAPPKSRCTFHVVNNQSNARQNFQKFSRSLHIY